jgi:hypothetical protein
VSGVPVSSGVECSRTNVGRRRHRCLDAGLASPRGCLTRRPLGCHGYSGYQRRDRGDRRVLETERTEKRRLALTQRNRATESEQRQFTTMDSTRGWGRALARGWDERHSRKQTPCDHPGACFRKCLSPHAAAAGRRPHPRTICERAGCSVRPPLLRFSVLIGTLCDLRDPCVDPRTAHPPGCVENQAVIRPMRS